MDQARLPHVAWRHLRNRHPPSATAPSCGPATPNCCAPTGFGWCATFAIQTSAATPNRADAPTTSQTSTRPISRPSSRRRWRGPLPDVAAAPPASGNSPRNQTPTVRSSTTTGQAQPANKGPRGMRLPQSHRRSPTSVPSPRWACQRPRDPAQWRPRSCPPLGTSHWPLTHELRCSDPARMAGGVRAGDAARRTADTTGHRPNTDHVPRRLSTTMNAQERTPSIGSSPSRDLSPGSGLGGSFVVGGAVVHRRRRLASWGRLRTLSEARPRSSSARLRYRLAWLAVLTNESTGTRPVMAARSITPSVVWLG